MLALAHDSFYTGLGAFVQGTDFNCKGTSCYGIGAEKHALFQHLQSLLNLFATPVGFASLNVDGLIGPSTVNAAVLVAKAIKAAGIPGGDLPVTAQVATGVSKETLAQLANDFVIALAAAGPAMVAQRTAAGLPASPVVAPTPVVKAGTATTPPDIPGSAAAAALATSIKGKKLLPWILGGLAAVLVVGGVGYVYYRRRRPRAFANYTEDTDE